MGATAAALTKAAVPVVSRSPGVTVSPIGTAGEDARRAAEADSARVAEFVGAIGVAIQRTVDDKSNPAEAMRMRELVVVHFGGASVSSVSSGTPPLSRPTPAANPNPPGSSGPSGPAPGPSGHGSFKDSFDKFLTFCHEHPVIVGTAVIGILLGSETLVIYKDSFTSPIMKKMITLIEDVFSLLGDALKTFVKSSLVKFITPAK